MSSSSKCVTTPSSQVVQSGDTKQARVCQELSSGGFRLRLLQVLGLGFIASHPMRTIFQSFAFFRVQLLLLVVSLPFAVSSLQVRVFQECVGSVTHDHVEASLFTLISHHANTRLTNIRFHVKLVNNLHSHLVLVLSEVAMATHFSNFRSCTW
jgi:hypothetical protein